MPKISFDFNIHFWLGLVIFAASAVSSGTIHLTNAIPMDWIPAATAWSGIISVLGTGYLTAALGLHNASPQAKIDQAAALPEVRGIVTTKQLASDIPSDKVVATPSDLPKG